MRRYTGNIVSEQHICILFGGLRGWSAMGEKVFFASTKCNIFFRREKIVLPIRAKISPPCQFLGENSFLRDSGNRVESLFAASRNSTLSNLSYLWTFSFLKGLAVICLSAAVTACENLLYFCRVEPQR